MKDFDKKQLRELLRKNLVKFRKEKGVTQSDVGAYLGIGKTGVASWEQGRTSPDAETVYLLSKYYRKPLESFYEEDSVPVKTIVSDIANLPNRRHHKIREVPIQVAIVDDNGKTKVVTLETQLKIQDQRLNKHEELLNSLLNKESKKGEQA